MTAIGMVGADAATAKAEEGPPRAPRPLPPTAGPRQQRARAAAGAPAPQDTHAFTSARVPVPAHSRMSPSWRWRRGAHPADASSRLPLLWRGCRVRTAFRSVTVGEQTDG
eukprot:gene5916-12415_t